MIELPCLSNIDGLIKSLGEERARRGILLSQHTTLGIGGPAEVFYEAESVGDLVKAIRLARSFGIPFTILGGGSNVLVSDSGVSGLVIKNRGGEIKISEKVGKYSDIETGGTDMDMISARWRASENGTMKYDFSDLNYSEEKDQPVMVTIDSGVNLQMAMMNLIDRGLTGLQWYARIPGTFGGAVYNNIHGGSHVFSELVKSVLVLGNDGEIRTIHKKDIGFDYDKSRFHLSGDVILSVELVLRKGDAQRAKTTALEWIKRKAVQPVNSAGCVFKNISEEERTILGYPTTATGYIVEHVLNMRGFGVGGAVISSDHHNFIVNRGGATAKDYLSVRNAIVNKAQEVLGLSLEDEIVYLGNFEY